MAEEDVVAISAPPADLKRKLDDVEPEVLEQHVGTNGVDDSKEASDFSEAKRPKLDDEAPECLDNGKTQENGSPSEVKDEEQREEEKQEEPKQEETKKPSTQNDVDQDSAVLVEEVKEPVDSDLSENATCGIDQPAEENVKPEDNQQSSIEPPISQENIVEECKDVKDGEPQKEIDDDSKELNDEPKKEVADESKELNDGASQNEIDKGNNELGGEPQREVDDTQSTTCRIDVPSSKVGVLIGKGGETIRYLQFNSGAKIQILRDSEADPNSPLRPVDLIGTVACIENAKKLINAVIAEAEAGGSPALVARGQHATHAIGISEQIEIKVPNDKVGIIIGRGGETIKNMQTRSGARIQLIPQHAEGDGFKERTVRISGNRRQIDIATDMIKDVMDQISPLKFTWGQHCLVGVQ